MLVESQHTINLYIYLLGLDLFDNCGSDVAGGTAIVGPQGDARSGLLSDYAVEEPCADGTDHCIVSITDAIRAENGGAPVTYSQGVEVNSLKIDGIHAALEVAKAADLVILALGIDKSQEGEGHDRLNIVLPGERCLTVTICSLRCSVTHLSTCNIGLSDRQLKS